MNKLRVYCLKLFADSYSYNLDISTEFEVKCLAKLGLMQKCFVNTIKSTMYY